MSLKYEPSSEPLHISATPNPKLQIKVPGAVAIPLSKVLRTLRFLRDYSRYRS